MGIRKAVLSSFNSGNYVAFVLDVPGLIKNNKYPQAVHATLGQSGG